MTARDHAADRASARHRQPEPEPEAPAAAPATNGAQAAAPATDGAQADFIGENLRRLFDDVAQEGVPDRISKLLAQLAEADAKEAGGDADPEGGA